MEFEAQNGRKNCYYNDDDDAALGSAARKVKLVGPSHIIVVWFLTGACRAHT